MLVARMIDPSAVTCTVSSVEHHHVKTLLPTEQLVTSKQEDQSRRKHWIQHNKLMMVAG